VTSRPSRDAVHYLRLVLLGAAIVGLGYVFFVAVANYAILTRRPCANGVEPLGVPTSGIFVFGSLISFWIGALVGRWRHFSGLAGELPPKRDWTRFVVHFALALFFTLAVVLLAYEAWAEWDPLARWPITSFVRCVDHNQTLYALGTTCALLFLLGQWQWHPWDTGNAT